MNKIAALATIIGITLATGSFCAATSHAQDITPTGTQPWRMTLRDGTKDGLVIHDAANALNQPFKVEDSNGWPIFEVHATGGASVDGDHFKIYGNGDIFNPVIDLAPDGSISITGAAAKVTLNGQTLTSADIAWIHNHE
jgi:hypothetical protein